MLTMLKSFTSPSSESYYEEYCWCQARKVLFQLYSGKLHSKRVNSCFCRSRKCYGFCRSQESLFDSELCVRSMFKEFSSSLSFSLVKVGENPFHVFLIRSPVSNELLPSYPQYLQEWQKQRLIYSVRIKFPIITSGRNFSCLAPRISIVHSEYIAQIEDMNLLSTGAWISTLFLDP